MRKWNSAFWGITAILLSILFIVTKNDPFFGDSISTISRAANNIYNSNFSQISYPDNLDPGHPISFPFIHALCWKVMGRTLWVSHALNLVFGVLILRLFIGWGKQLGYQKTTYIGAFFLLVTPLFVSQLANPNLHLPLTYFSLGFVYTLSYGPRWQQIIFASALVFTHLQGLYYLTPIAIWWFFKKEETTLQKRIIESLKLYWIPLVLFLIWLLYHHSITGWYLSSPDYSGHRGFPGIKRFIINLIMADWRIIDYGQIALWILPIYAMIRRKMEWKWDHPFTLFLIVFLFNSLAIGFTTKTGPMHRYLLPCLPLLVMANVHLLRTKRPTTVISLLLLLISGHFWFYPGKIMGDATLSYRSVFPLLKEAKTDFNQATFYTYAPLSNPGCDTYLNTDSADYVALYDIDMETAPFVIYSNISGDFSVEQVSALQSQWPCKTYESGYVYLEVYSNPSLIKQPLTNDRRKPSAFEQWFIKLKHTIKGTDGV